MKAKLIFVFLLAAGVIFALTMTASATTPQNQNYQTIVTPQPVTPTPIIPDCFLENTKGYNRPIDCLPNRLGNPELLGVNSFPAILSQSNLLVWQPVTNPSDQSLGGLSMLTATDGWAVGDNGMTLHWDGNSWQIVTSPTTNRINAVHMVAANDVWAVGGLNGENSTILHWNGSVWQIVTSPSSLELNSVYMISANDGWIVGGSTPNSVILHWDGNTWSIVSSPAPSPAILIDIYMLSSTDGWAVGNYGTILHWDGSTWQLVTSPTTLYIISIDMVSANDGWAVGGLYPDGQIYHWDGSSWQIFSAPASNELAAVSMVSSTDGWAVSWYGGELLHWDGASWTKSSSPVSVRTVDMLSSSDGWAVGGGIMHYTAFNGLTVHVDNANGQPAFEAYVRVYTPDGYYVANGYSATDTNGDAFLNIQPGTYHVIAYSASEHFGLYQLNITSPSTVNLTAVDTPVIALTAKKRDNTSLDQAYVRVALSSGQLYNNLSLGQVNTTGEMTFNVTPGIYDVNVIDSVNYYDLLKRQQAFSGEGGLLDFNMSTNPTAEIVVSHPGESIDGMYLFHPGARVYGNWFSNVAEGTHIVLSANEDYSAYQSVLKAASNGDLWYYSLDENRPDSTFQPGEVFTFTVGGALAVSGRTDPAYVGDYISVADTRDSHDNSLTYIYTTTADYTWGNSIDPYIYLTDPNGTGHVLDWNWYFIPYDAPTGWYQVYYEWETGPYQGLLSTESSFEVKPISTSAIIPTGGGVFTSTFDNTSYAFANGTFTDTVIVTHTVRFADIPSFGEMVGIGHTFDITAVYSSTGQPAQPTQPYTIIIRYTDGEKGSVTENTLALYYWDGNQWVMETSSVVDTQNNTLTATPSHFSLWAVMGETQRVFLPFIRR
jgi:photosystem II stability/assembly factor-like uncharacterized protein